MNHRWPYPVAGPDRCRQQRGTDTCHAAKAMPGRRITQAISRVSLVLLVIMLAAGLFVPACDEEAPAAPAISWQHLKEDQPVFGIVRLAVQAVAGRIEEVKYYLGDPDTGNLLGTAIPDGDEYVCDWFTQEFHNGTYTLHALATFQEGDSHRISRTVTVNNLCRYSTIPASAVKMTPDNDPVPPQLAEGFKEFWHDPVPMEGPINSAGLEDSPFITPDGNTFYFWFSGDAAKTVYEQAEDPMTGIYWSHRVDGVWQEPERLFLQYYDKIGFDGDPTVWGDTLYFGSIREGVYSEIDIWIARLVDGRWIDWTNAGRLFNVDYGVGELHVTSGGNEIYFGSTRAGGQGGGDIWVIRKVGDEWMEPENVTAVNTPGHEGQPFISEDGKELWFTRLSPGPEVWRSLKVDGEWQAPERVIYNLAGEPTLDLAGNIYFVHHRWDTDLGRATEADIYVCYRK